MGDHKDDEGSAQSRYWAEPDKYLDLVKQARSVSSGLRSNNPVEDGDDLAHDVVRKSLEMTGDQWDGIENPGGYTRRMVWHGALARLRKRRREGELEEFGDPPSATHSEKAYAAALLVEEGLQKLPPDERALLELAEVEGLSGKELAEVFGLSPDALRQRLSRVRRKLRSFFSASGTEAPRPE